MDQSRIDALKEVYKKNGTVYFQDLRKAEGVLKDFFPDMPRVANTMLISLKVGALDSLVGSDQYSMPQEVLFSNIAKQMVDDFAVKESDAIEAVCIWGEVFGQSNEAFSSTMKSRFETVTRTQTNSVPTSTYSTLSREVIACPFCGEEILAKAKVCKHCHSNLQQEIVVATPSIVQKETKECPFCGEEILVKAKFCKHCHSNLEEIHQEILPAVSQPVTTSWASEQATSVSPQYSYDADIDDVPVKQKSYAIFVVLVVFFGALAYFYLNRPGYAIFIFIGGVGASAVFPPAVFAYYIYVLINGYAIVQDINANG